jgi:hypothetical protein
MASSDGGLGMGSWSTDTVSDAPRNGVREIQQRFPQGLQQRVEQGGLDGEGLRHVPGRGSGLAQALPQLPVDPTEQGLQVIAGGDGRQRMALSQVLDRAEQRRAAGPRQCLSDSRRHLGQAAEGLRRIPVVHQFDEDPLKRPPRVLQFFVRPPLTLPVAGVGSLRIRATIDDPGYRPGLRRGTVPVAGRPPQQTAQRHHAGTGGCRPRLSGLEQCPQLPQVAQQRLHAFRAPVTTAQFEIEAARMHLRTENVGSRVARGAPGSRLQLIEAFACEAQTVTAIPVPGIPLQGPLDPGEQVLERAAIPGFVRALHVRLRRPSVVGLTVPQSPLGTQSAGQ